MKKLFFLVAVATPLFFSCQVEFENVPVEECSRFTIEASIDDMPSSTKADINASSGLNWTAGDKIGIYVNDPAWDDKNQPFTLVGEGGSATGQFAWDHTGDFSTLAAAAFFPWEGTGADKNNVADGTMYFKLRDSYWSYTSGKLLSPLVASLSGSSDMVRFKHAAAGVKVTINNLPARSHSIGMSVDGQQITGNYSINPANAGTDAIALVGDANLSNNTVWLNFWQGSESAFTFVFPVPELTKPKLSFQIWDDNDILVWSKNLKAQSSDLGRGDLLVLPAIDITPYSQFSESADWTFYGTINGSSWGDVPMYTDGSICILHGITFAAGDEFKIRKDKAWAESYPASNWSFNDGNKGTKDIIFHLDTHDIDVIDAKGCPYPAPKVTLYFGINNSIPNGVALSSSGLGASGWPGVTLTRREYINNKWYYKYEVDGGVVWGKTMSASIVGIDQWNTNSTTLDFTDISTEYYFEATKNTDIEALTGRPSDPAHHAITLGTNLTDWDEVIGVTEGNHTVKVESDADYIYVYSARTNASGDYSAIWNNGGYVYVLFDLDNDPSTYEADFWGTTGDFVLLLYPYAGTSESPAFNASKTAKWDYGPTSGYTIDNIALYGEETSGTAAFELRIPRADMPTVSNTDPITITLKGNKGMSQVSLVRKL